MTDVHIELCPFCGGRASSSQQTTGGRWAAYCLNCEAMVDGEFSELDAIAAWNRRASPAPAISESEDARDAARYRHLRAYYTRVVFMQEDGPSVDLRAISEIGDAYEMQVLDAAIDAARKGEKS
ncbi:Lar family restriction alleviation protein [Burkholderia gladioli]|uniref:Lar family restriction alleviation protein n=1 Tax=Burkholderia gladioli TaxID=28095 RepID=A0AB38U5N7_BURGA|nr:Lar family restriction alleviation protein [Burkholderia gladioli]UWX75328.1 Lar family restriction alleviation protein [Burkholderia gladioli]